MFYSSLIRVYTILDFWPPEKRITNHSAYGQSSLDAICKHSLFKSEQALLRELEDMKQNVRGHDNPNFKGTKIVIYGLKK